MEKLSVIFEFPAIFFFVSANSCSQDNFYIVVDAYDDANLTMSKNGLPTVR